MRADATKATGTQAYAEGSGTTASGLAAHAEGESCTASGNQSHAGGWTSTAAGSVAFAHGSTASAAGTYAVALGQNSAAPGNNALTTGLMGSAGRKNQRAHGTSIAGVAGQAQWNRFLAGRDTTDATPSLLNFNGSAASATLTGSGTNVLTIPADRVHRFCVNVAARRVDVSGDAAGWKFEGLIARGSSGDAAFVGTIDGRAWGTAGAAAWDVTLSINTTDATNNYLAITVTGEAAKTIRWLAEIETVEVG